MDEGVARRRDLRGHGLGRRRPRRHLHPAHPGTGRPGIPAAARAPRLGGPSRRLPRPAARRARRSAAATASARGPSPSSGTTAADRVEEVAAATRATTGCGGCTAGRVRHPRLARRPRAPRGQQLAHSRPSPTVRMRFTQGKHMIHRPETAALSSVVAMVQTRIAPRHLVVVGGGMVARRLVDALRSRDDDGAVGRHAPLRGAARPLRPGRADLLLHRPRPRRPRPRRPGDLGRPAGHPASRRGRHRRRPRGPHGDHLRRPDAPLRLPRAGHRVVCRRAAGARARTCAARSSTAPSTTSPTCGPTSRTCAPSATARCAGPSSAAACSASRRPTRCARSGSRRTSSSSPRG